MGWRLDYHTSRDTIKNVIYNSNQRRLELKIYVDLDVQGLGHITSHMTIASSDQNFLLEDSS